MLYSIFRFAQIHDTITKLSLCNMVILFSNALYLPAVKPSSFLQKVKNAVAFYHDVLSILIASDNPLRNSDSKIYSL